MESINTEIAIDDVECNGKREDDDLYVNG